MAGCSAQIRLARHIERDDTLKHNLRAVPHCVDRVWVNREGSVTAVVQHTGAGTESDPKRQRLDVTSDERPAVVVDEDRRLYWATQVTKVKQEHAE